MEREDTRLLWTGALLAGLLSLLTAQDGTSWAGSQQESDPYRAPLLPIHGRPPTTESTGFAEQPGLAVLNTSVRVGPGQPAALLPPATRSDDEALPNPKSTDTQDNSADAGIVRLLKPLALEPQTREVLTQRYPTGQVMIERQVAQDQHGNYLNDGLWKMYDTDQRLIGDGRFERGQMVGLWRRVHLESDHPWFNTNDFRGFTPPLISSAEFVDGQLNGSWLIKDRQERKIVELNYRSGKRHGAGSWWFPNGQLRRQLQFEEDLLHGLWQEWNVEGQLQTENWFLEGQRIDKEINYFAANRPESEQSFLDGQLTLDGQDDWWNARLATYQRTGQRIQTGPVKAWYDNGQRHMAGYYKDGLRHGEFAWWHANGNRKLICNYQNGQRVGKWVWWHENGIKAAEGSYVDDLPAGEWLAWNEQGEITNSRDWEADRQSVARPTFEPPPADLELEELPAQKGLEAPLIPSLDQVELPPPTLNDTPPASGDSEVELDGPAGGSDVDPPPRPAGDQPAID